MLFLTLCPIGNAVNQTSTDGVKISWQCYYTVCQYVTKVVNEDNILKKSLPKHPPKCSPCGQPANGIDNIGSQCYSKREANMLMRYKDELWA